MEASPGFWQSDESSAKTVHLQPKRSHNPDSVYVAFNCCDPWPAEDQRPTLESQLDVFYFHRAPGNICLFSCFEARGEAWTEKQDVQRRMI